MQLPTKLSAIGTITSIFASNTQNASERVSQLAGAFSVLTPAQIANYASLQKLTEQQLLEILDLATLSKEQKDQVMNMYLAATATNTYAGAASGATAATGGLAAGFKGLTAAIAANPWGFAITALATLITLSVSWQKAQEKAFQEAIDNAQKLQEEYQDTFDTIDGNVKTVESLRDEFKKLSIGVDENGKNISLSTTEYDRYKSIVNDLIDLNPTLVQGYDAERQAIIDKNTAIQDTIAYLKEERRQSLINATSPENNWTIAHGKSNEYKNAVNAVNSNQVVLAETLWSAIRDSFEYSEYGSLVSANGHDLDELRKKLIDTFNLPAEQFKNTPSDLAGWQEMFLSIEGQSDDFAKTVTGNLTSVYQLLDFLGSNSQYALNNSINVWQTSVKQADTASKGYQAHLDQIAQADEAYEKLSKGSKKFVHAYIDTMKIGADETQSSADSMTATVQTLIGTLSSPDNVGLQTKVDKLFSIDFSKLNASEIQSISSNIDEIFESLRSEFDWSDDDIKALRVALGIDVDFTAPDGTKIESRSQLIGYVGGKIRSMFGDDAASEIGTFNAGQINWLFSTDMSQYSGWHSVIEAMKSDMGTSEQGASSLKDALSKLSDETTVLRDALAKLGEGSTSFDQWVGNSENLKALLDKIPDLRDELEAYANAVAAGEDPQEAFVTLQRAMNAALQDFEADTIYDAISDVTKAAEEYGATSHVVLQKVQNLSQHIPGLVDKLYDEHGALTDVGLSAVSSSDALYDLAKNHINLMKQFATTDASSVINQLDAVGKAAVKASMSMTIAQAGVGAIIGDAGQNLIKNSEQTAIQSYLDSLLASVDTAWSRHTNTSSKSSSKKTSSQKEVYVPDVDPLYQYLQTVEDINDELDGLDFDEKLLDEDDFESKNTLIEARIKKLEELKTALHALNNARDVEISTAVDKLNGYGNFQATYNKESGQALINNMDALKGLTGDTAKAAEKLIDYIENGSKAAISSSHEYMDALVEQNNLLKEQKELQEEQRELREDEIDDRIERHRNAISLLQSQQGVSEGNLDYQAAVNSLKEQKLHWVEIQNIAHRMAEEIRAAHPGITDDDPLLKKWIDLWWEASGEINTANEKFVEDSLARLDSFIQQADNFNWWDNIDTTKVDMLEKKLETIHQLYADGIIPDAATYKKLVDETAKEIYDEKLNAIEQVIDYTKKLIEEEVRLRKEELEEQVDDYKKIVDLKKEALRASKDEADYQKSVAEKTKAIAKLQQQINTLALSDDRRDIAERKKLEEELAELQGELADTQADHTLDAQEKALDDSYDAFEKEKNDEVKKLEATIDTEGKLYALAIERIDNDWDALYRDLMQMNSLYWDGIAGEAGIKGAWDTAKQAAEDYRGTLETIQGIEKERAAVSGTGTSVGSSVISDKNAAYLTGDIDKQKELQAIGAEMQTNSQMWHTAYNANNKGQMEALQKANQRLANKVKDLTGQAPVFDSRDGYWKLANGEHFYEVYHGGGIVGSDEEFAKLQKGELVVPKDQVKPTMMMLEWGNSLASKMRGLFSKDGIISSAMTDAIKGTPLSPAAGAIVNNNAPSFAPNIQVEVKYDSSASPGDAKRFGENVTAGMLEAFDRMGIGRRVKTLGVTI